MATLFLGSGNEQEESLSARMRRGRDYCGHSTTGVWTLGSDSRTGHWSASLYQLLGYKPFSVKPTLKRFLKHVHPDDHATLKAFLDTSKRSGDVYRHLLNITTISSENRLCLLSFDYIADKSESIQSTFVIIQDLTDRIQMDDALNVNKEKLEKFVLNKNKDLLNAIDRCNNEISERINSEKKLEIFKLMVNSSNNAQAFIDKNKKILIVNNTYENLVNEPEKRIIGNNFELFLKRKMGEYYYNKEIKPYFEKSLLDGETCTHKGWTDVGQSRKFLYRIYTPCRDDSKRISGVIITLHDLTHLMSAEEQARKNEQLFLTLGELAPIGIVISDRENKTIYLSPSFEKILGYTREDIPTMDAWWPLAYPDPNLRESIKRKWAEDVAAAMRDRTETPPYDIPVTCKDGTVRHMDVRLKSAGDCSVVTFTDLSYRKEAEKKLRHARDIVENIHTSLYVYQLEDLDNDRSLRMVEANPATEKLTGIKVVDVLGKTIDENFPGLRKTGIPHRFAEVVRSRQSAEIGDVDYEDDRVRRAVFSVKAFSLPDNHLGVAFEDITASKRAEQMTEIRLRLIEFASDHSLPELMTSALDEIERFLDSSISFLHFVEPDQKTLSLQQWSSATVERFCKAPGQLLHYNINQAGVWVECVREGRGVIHNDYASLPNKKGLPSGHVEVIREMVVPVLRQDVVVAILGVGNKPMDYSHNDMEELSFLADVTWEIIRRKKAETALAESLARYNDLITRVPVGVYVVWTRADGRHEFEYVSDRWCAIHQVRREDVLADSMVANNLAHPDEREAFLARNRQAHLDRKPFLWEGRFIAGSEVRWLRIESTSVIFDNGDARWFGVTQDITERKLTEIELQRSRELLDSTQALAKIGGWEWDVAQQTMYWTDEAYRIHGFQPGEVEAGSPDHIARSLQCYDPDDRPVIVAAFQRCVEQGQAYDLDFQITKTDGCRIWIRTMAHAVQVNGRVVKIQGNIFDITERRKTREAIEQINQELRISNAEKDRLFTIIAHDLKAPMAGILSATGMLADQAEIFSEQEIRLLSTELHNNAKNTFALLEDLLQWSRMSQGGIDFDPGPCSLHDLINISFFSAQGMAKDKDVAIRLDIPQGLTVCVDQPMINTVIRNILFNAIKFSLRGGEIVITAQRNGKTVTVAIQDNGIGMNEQVLPSVFSLQKEKRHLGTEGETGTGLGLVLCKQFIDRHGGEIWVESEPGQGTTVFFTLPIDA
ncbi:PAS domain S-box protein [Desulfonatronum thiodismutans]|uniref:PAS domain S-box protein n=1 Tax=Desulfonatronum thiodismutans TaxID=159290 RepID=UPI001F355ECF|nr:PAS domain S-box protein [Desulfonatronum thiodismutans]